MRAKLFALGCAGAALVAAAACSSATGGNKVEGSGGGSSGSGAGGSSASGGTGATGSGGSSGSGAGGSGGFGAIGGGGGSAGAIEADASCASVAKETKSGLQPADIIWLIDTSGSMTEEVPSVQDNMNAFSTQIIQSGIDVHVILIAAYKNFLNPLGICMPPPLGKAGGCPSTAAGSDNNLPTFFHDPNPPIGVQSTNGFHVLINLFPHYDPLLRTGASHWVVAVTDDDASDAPWGTLSADAGADQWIAAYKALSPKLADFKMSGITSLSMCPNAANIGVHWQSAIAKTGGLSADICACAPGQTAQCSAAFQSIFTQLADKIVQAAQPLDCQWPIPAPPAGQTFDKTKVNVQFTDQSGTTDLFHVDTAADCDPQQGGWYYDNDANPTQVISCPASCNVIKNATNAKINVLFGCATVQAPPH